MTVEVKKKNAPAIILGVLLVLVLVIVAFFVLANSL